MKMHLGRAFVGWTAMGFVGGGLVFRYRNQSHLDAAALNSSSLTGKTYVITGGTSGIGKAVVDELVASGARVVVGARKSERSTALEEQVHI